MCRRKNRSCMRAFRRTHGEIPWSFGLGMHWFRKFERDGDSKSRHVPRLKWFKSGGLLRRDETNSGIIMVKKGAEKRNYVKNPSNRRQVATCLTKIGSVSLFGLKVPRMRKKKFFLGKSRAVPDKPLRRFAPSISSMPRTPSLRFQRRARSFVRSVFIRGAGHTPPYMLKKVPNWECLVLLNFRRLGHQGVLKWWSEKFPPEPQIALPRGCNFCLRRRKTPTDGCIRCAAVQHGCGICEGKSSCSDCLFPPFCANRRLGQVWQVGSLSHRWKNGDFSGPKFGTLCGPCGCRIGNFFPK